MHQFSSLSPNETIQKNLFPRRLTWKQAQTNEFKALMARTKLSKWSPEIFLTPRKTWLWTPANPCSCCHGHFRAPPNCQKSSPGCSNGSSTLSFLLLPWSPRCSQIAKMLSRPTKTGASGVPHDIFQVPAELTSQVALHRKGMRERSAIVGVSYIFDKEFINMGSKSHRLDKKRFQTAIGSFCCCQSRCFRGACLSHGFLGLSKRQ